MLKAIAMVMLLLGAALGIQAIPVAAAAVTKPSTQGPSMGGGSSSGKNVLAQLEAAKHLLERGKHDYDGHRAKAVHEVSAAIKDLEYKHPTHSPMHAQGGKAGGNTSSLASLASSKPANAGADDKESQPKSDALLHHAIRDLEAALKELHGEHHKKAAQAIEAAIHELHLALKVA